MTSLARLTPEEVSATSASENGVGKWQNLIVSAVTAAGVAAFALIGLTPLRDPDLWWHLRTGAELQDGSPFVTHGGTPMGHETMWIRAQWGSDLVLKTVFDLAGYSGLLIVHITVLGCVALAIIHTALRVRRGIPALIMAAVALSALVPYSTERPQLVSFALLPLFTLRLLRSVESGDADWSLIPIVWVWSWFHGLWSAALLLYAALLVAVLWTRRDKLTTARDFTALGLALFLVPLAGPLGWHVYHSPLRIRAVSEYIAEWQAPELSRQPWAVFVLVLAAVVLVAAMKSRRMPAHAIALLVVAGYFAFSYVRGLPVAALMLLPVATAACHQLLRGDGHRATAATEPFRPIAGRLALAGIVGLAIIISPLLRPTAETHERVLAVMEDRLGKASVWTTDPLGSRMLWFAPKLRPTLTGRTDMYPPEFIRRVVRTNNAQGNWRRTIESSGVDAVWLDKDFPLVQRLQREESWSKLTSDKTTVVLVPPRGEPGRRSSRRIDAV